MAGIRRGTTPTHTFTVDVDLTDAEVIFITYEQNDKTVIEKTKEDLTITAEQIELTLSQKDTLALDLKTNVEMQIRAKFGDGSAVASEIMKASPEKILKDGEI